MDPLPATTVNRSFRRTKVGLAPAGAALANLLMGIATWSLVTNGPSSEYIASNFVLVFSILYGMNMYFQSFGAIAVVKCNAPWFHVRERGVFGAIFGILISLGIYFAFDWGYSIVYGFEATEASTLIKNGKDIGLGAISFPVPTILLAIFGYWIFLLVQNSPEDAGLEDLTLQMHLLR